MAQAIDDGEVSSSEDVLTKGGDEWQWVYGDEIVESDRASPNPKKRKASETFPVQSSRRIVAARRGDVELRLGDAVLLKAARNEQWVAIISQFLQDDVEDEQEARFMWFTSPKDIRNKAKRRTDAMSVCSSGSLRQKEVSDCVPE